jgi:hypothetical protein
MKLFADTLADFSLMGSTLPRLMKSARYVSTISAVKVSSLIASTWARQDHEILDDRVLRHTHGGCLEAAAV